LKIATAAEPQKRKARFRYGNGVEGDEDGNWLTTTLIGTKKVSGFASAASRISIRPANTPMATPT
jgi:hypothetical protein